MTTVDVSPQHVIVGQPVDVKVGIFTSTYFTKGAEFEKISIPSAFIIPYTKPLSTNTQVDGKIWYGVEYSYKLFPARKGEILFPSVQVTVYSPDEGGYKAEPRTIKTPERRIVVMAVPDGYARDEWLVAQNVTIRENWNKSIEKLQVGDAVERSITINAAGTVAALIPPVPHDSLEWGSLYLKSPMLTDDHSDGLAAQRIERLTYLAERAGSFQLPAISVGWWNPATQKFSKRVLPARDILIDENPDLEMLRTMQDSLNALKNAGFGESEKRPVTILGLSLWQLIFVLLFFVVVFIIANKVVNGWIRIHKERIERYRQSEAFYFDQFKNACTKGDPALIYQDLRLWCDKLPGDRMIPVRDFIDFYGDESLAVLFTALDEHLFRRPEKELLFSGNTLFLGCKKVRSRYFQKEKFVRLTELPELNPVEMEV